MCGVLAVVGQVSDFNPSDALGALEHRGPDSEGEWVSPSRDAWLGHRRLAIVDLSDNGRQPMVCENRRFVLSYNGEIYNAVELKAQLEARGHRFKSQCDSEVLLNGYIEWGRDLLDRLIGMFAFVIWDDEKKEAFGARDRVGIKPLYMCRQQQGLIVASEAQGIVAGFGHDPQLDPMSLAYVLTLGYVPSPRSIWAGIEKIEPGHAFSWSSGKGCRTWKYWEPPRDLDYVSASNGGFEDMFHRVMSDHMMSDVPIGLFLSSGLDSSSLALALSTIGNRPQALTIGFANAENDESPVARETAAMLGLDHKTITLDPQDIHSLGQETLAAYDEPQGYSALMTSYRISAQAAQNYKVVFSGDGGDEVWGGYSWYNNLSQPLYCAAGMARAAVRPLVRTGGSETAWKIAMHSFARSSVLSRHATRLFPRFLPEEVEKLFGNYSLRFKDDDWLEPLASNYESRLPRRRALQRVDLMTFCSESCLPKVDRASMAHSLEVRVPFLDHRLVEWGLSRPVTDAETTSSKHVLREYLKGRVPSSVLERPKQGFSMRGGSKTDFSPMLDLIRSSGLVDGGHLSFDWERYARAPRPYRRARIWTLFALSTWFDSHVAKRKGAKKRGLKVGDRPAAEAFTFAT